jgi:hypothetical protein
MRTYFDRSNYTDSSDVVYEAQSKAGTVIAFRLDFKQLGIIVHASGNGISSDFAPLKSNSVDLFWRKLCSQLTITTGIRRILRLCNIRL